MTISFFKTDCQEAPRREALIGICDDENGKRAYTDIVDTDKWIARIKNNNNLLVTFTAIDNCLILLKDGTKDLESTCDGMLTFKNGLYLVELKNQRTGG